MVLLNEIALLTEVDDWELLRASMRGEGSAFSELVARYRDSAVTFCRQMLGDHQKAEDVVQLGFLKVYRARERAEERARFRTFFFKILTNLCLTERRRRNPGVTTADSADPDLDSTNTAAARQSFADPSRIVEQKELSEQIAAAVELLPPKHRAALFLREHEEMAYADIAVALGASLAEVKIWIHRARRRLMDSLRPYLERGGSAS